MGTARQRAGIPQGKSGVGLLLVNSSLRMIYANSNAIHVLTYPEGPRHPKTLDGILSERIRKDLFGVRGSANVEECTEFVSGKRHYACRFFALSGRSKSPGGPATAVLFERSPHRFVDVTRLAAEFHFTRREREVVELLLEGLTSKEIAQRMRISPNTVKAFLRFIMAKMGVSTRAGIIGKIVQTASS